MSPRLVQIQLAALGVLGLVATVASLVYIVMAQPESLRESRAGVPFFTPQVMDPDTGEGVSVDTLVQHFKSGQ